MSTATFGTANEDNAHLSKSDSKAVRRRSLALLGSLIRPVRLRFWLTIATVVLSQAASVAGPALIAFGIDHALPALQAGDNLPLVLTGVGYLAAAVATAGLTALYVTSTARLSQAMLLDLRRAGLPAHAAAKPGIPRKVHLGPDHRPADLGPGGAARTPRFGREFPGLGHALYGLHRRHGVRAGLAERADCAGRRRADVLPVALVPEALPDRVP